MTVKANNTICSKANPPEMTTEQVEECKFGNDGLGCRHISKLKLWCCKCGIWIKVGGGKTIQPKENLILPENLQTKKLCNETDFEVDYKTAMSGHRGYIGELLTLTEYVQRRIECKNCSDRLTCPVKECSRWQVLVEKKRECLKGKFQGIINEPI